MPLLLYLLLLLFCDPALLIELKLLKSLLFLQSLLFSLGLLLLMHNQLSNILSHLGMFHHQMLLLFHQVI